MLAGHGLFTHRVLVEIPADRCVRQDQPVEITGFEVLDDGPAIIHRQLTSQDPIAFCAIAILGIGELVTTVAVPRPCGPEFKPRGLGW